jgi:alkylation response protein AidB-like acyl-CoA dehydrogenase
MIAERFLGDEHRIFRDMAHRFVDRELMPYREEWESQGVVPREVWRKAGDAGLLCCDVPETYGGAGAGYLYNVIVGEALARCGGAGPNIAVHADISVPYVTHFGNEAQKRHWLPKAVSGEALFCLGMTEPHAGSDLQAIRTTARRDGDEFVIKGQKTYISNAKNADVCVLACKTDTTVPGSRGISLILVETNRPGFELGRMLQKIGRKAQDTMELFFDDVRVPVSNLIGKENNGFPMLLTFLIQERLSSAVRSTAVMDVVLEDTIAWVKDRRAFGKTIAEFQNTQFEIADVWSMLQSQKAYLEWCIGTYLDGNLSSAEAAAVKLRATELEGQLIDRCLQFFGGAGYMWETPIARFYADARNTRISAGSNHILKMLIGRDLLNLKKERAPAAAT